MQRVTVPLAVFGLFATLVGCAEEKQPDQPNEVVEPVAIRAHTCVSSAQALNERRQLDVTVTGAVVEPDGEATFRPFKCDVENVPATQIAIEDGEGGQLIIAFGFAVGDAPLVLNLPAIGTDVTVHVFDLEEEEFFPARGITISDAQGLLLAFDDLEGLSPRAGGSFPELAGLTVTHGENEGEPFDAGLCGTVSRTKLNFEQNGDVVVVSNDGPNALTLGETAFTAHNLGTESSIETTCDDFITPSRWLLLRDSD